MPGFAQRLSRIQPSATVAVSQRAKELKSQGVDVLSFSVGEPDFEPPEHILEAAVTATRKGCSKYTIARGIPALRDAICADSKARRGGHGHDPSEVVVSVGAKHSLFNLATCLFEEGDEVVIPAPYWVSYPAQVELMGAKAVIVDSSEENGFCVEPAALEKAITEKTKAVVLCSPSNPTGAAYDAQALTEIAEVLLRHDVWVITDEIYARLTYGDFVQKSLLEVAPDLRRRLIIVDGVSKTFAMTGWRIGWILAPEPVAKACDKIQSQSTTNPAAVAQYAAIAALTGPQEPMEAMRQAFQGRRTQIVDGLNGIEGISCRVPEGAFYAFPNVGGLIGKTTPSGTVLTDDLQVAQWLLEDARCALVPGSAFGAPGYLRMSYATANATIDQGLARIATAVASLT